MHTVREEGREEAQLVLAKRLTGIRQKLAQIKDVKVGTDLERYSVLEIAAFVGHNMRVRKDGHEKGAHVLRGGACADGEDIIKCSSQANDRPTCVWLLEASRACCRPRRL
jgi:hypothetical protein